MTYSGSGVALYQTSEMSFLVLSRVDSVRFQLNLRRVYRLVLLVHLCCFNETHVFKLYSEYSQRTCRLMNALEGVPTPFEAVHVYTPASSWVIKSVKIIHILLIQ